MKLLAHVAAVMPSRYGLLALYLLAAIFAYYALDVLYRLTLHPLAKYPGPLLQKISDWPMIAQCYNGNRHIALLQAHEKYGPVVRTGPTSLSLNTAEALQAVHTDRSANVMRGDWYRTLDQSSGAYSTQSCMDKQEHLFRRRILSQAFSERALRDAETFVMNNVKIFCERMGEGAEKPGQWTPEKNMSDWATYFSFDFISDLSFGRAFGMLSKEEVRYIPMVLRQTSQFLYYIGYLPFAAIIRPFLGTPVLDYVGGSAAADSLKFTNLANAQLAWRVDVEDQAQKAGKEVRRDVFHHVLHAADPETGKKFTREELQADSGLLIAAGSDGIAMTVSACIFYLLTNPETYEKLTAELRSAFKEAEEIRMPGVNKLPYLMACIQETLRISPALPASMPRLVLPGGLAIPSNNANSPPILIPAGTTVGVPAYAIHHNETYYPSSWTFRPERWIVSDTTSADQVALARKAFCPFSAGSMDCVGKNMAYLALKLALANLLWRYEVRLAEGKMTGGGGAEVKEEGRQRVGEYQMVDFIAAYRDGPIVELRERVRGDEL